MSSAPPADHDKKENTDDNNTTTTSSQTLTKPIPFHSLLSNLHRSHGVLQNDYTQYRQYCTRRISRLRHSPAVKQNLVNSNTSSSSKTSSHHGGKHAYCPRNNPPSIANEHENYILVVLLQAERAWSHAMELKSTHDKRLPTTDATTTSSGRKPPPSKGALRQSYIKKLRKAVTHAGQLETLISSLSPSTTPSSSTHLPIEAKAYASWMRGNYAIEKCQWDVASGEYNTALNLYRALADADTGDLEMTDFFGHRATHVVEPLLKYCRYESSAAAAGGDEEKSVAFAEEDEDEDDDLLAYRQMPPSKLTTMREAHLEKDARIQFATLEFRGRTIAIEDQSLRMALARIGSSPSSSSSGGDSSLVETTKISSKALVRLLSAYDDAYAMARTSLGALEALQSGPAVNEKKREVMLLCQFLKHGKLTLLMRRNEDMVDELRKADERHCHLQMSEREGGTKRVEQMAHLYDALLQDATTIADMRIPRFDADDVQEEEEDEEDEFLLEAKAHVLRFRARRCYYMGRMYAADDNDNDGFAKAGALFEQTIGLADRAAEELAACQNPSIKLVEDMNALEREVAGAKCRVEAEAFLASVGGGVSSTTKALSKRCLLKRLGDYDDGGGKEEACYRLLEDPLELEYVPCKPTFFDIALNYLGEMPQEDLNKCVDEYGVTRSARGSIFGWFTRS